MRSDSVRKMQKCYKALENPKGKTGCYERTAVVL
jgi:hypothetical protein